MPHYIADLHFHSKYSRAVSRDMDLEHIAQWARTKGIDVATTADFTHPVWYAELQKKLQREDDGLYSLKNNGHATRFMLTTEISCIYSKSGKTRRVHHVIIMPDLEAVKKINGRLNLIGNLKSDGRPILGLDSKELLKIVLDTSPDAMLIPAHIWTPWFSMFGSMSGFDTVEECFEDLSPHIHAVETGLSSDPAMNWRLSQLDRMQIVSFSDAHSPQNLGREATVFELPQLSYGNLTNALKGKKTTSSIAHTIEFYPEEGRYHWDGHRNCAVRLAPAETKKLKGICPKCKKRMTVGVLYRANLLADRPDGYKPANRPPYRSLVPLREIIGEALNVGPASKKVQAEYESLIQVGKNELNILLNVPTEELAAMTLPKIAEGIERVRAGKLTISPGYDGEYGTVHVFSEAERAAPAMRQSTLF
ncbi:MAG: endonuclease Q family protein [Patescibacteria group bacterium]|nr:endonuclease Q family protein [Patescibacteria group bacterium]MDD5715910.1 endonuclease Q family protein [Patescibacteria group bacterium]